MTSDPGDSPRPEPRAAEPPPPPARATRLLDQSFELEMLISGAVLFLALQLPAWLDEVVQRAFRNPWRVEAVYVLVLMAKGALNVFILNQLLHLVVRTVWVGTVGIRLQYPDGPDIARLSAQSQSARRRLLTRYGDLAAAQDRLEHLARLLFSISIGFTVLFLTSAFLTAVGFGLHLLLGLLVPGLTVPPYGTVLVLTLLPAAAIYLDRLLDRPRLQALRRPWLDRLLQPFATNTWLPGTGMVMPLLLTLGTRMPKRSYALLLLVYLGLFAVGTMGPLFWTAATRLFPRSTGPITHTAWYENTRQPPDDLYRGPILHTEALGQDEAYLQVFLPLAGDLLDSLAPAHPILARLGGLSLASPQPGDSLALVQARDAYLAAYAISLNGRPLPNANFRWYRHPRVQMDGLQAFVRTDTLAPGVHHLGSQRPFPRPGEPRVLQIPFYR